MAYFLCHLTGEDGLEFSVDYYDMQTHAEAKSNLEISYPEAKIDGIYSEIELAKRDVERERRLVAIYDDPSFDDYDY